MSGKASAEEAFQLARLGVRAYLHKPLDLATLHQALEEALAQPPELETHLRSAVGKIAIKDAERLVRSTMVDEAMARSAGNRRGAARLLDISRELLQHILRAHS
jgi:DNA-binding NtrC family response regulator